ncbi:sulfite exporter TauE/SafE family protein [Flagellimonas sp. HMM57]|uniref:sulfite exporter TauE/SafE family protein n=1 Tax=unclassified Flagellimonas TaxID=2644544 RepID=UPI0013D80AC0|nr:MULTISPECIES: sulfite exporter TauE/SafE family protein [unclassified Flagellimonas]UII77209.1 sulfite exporter TauE/SafE family protein [Flagellimonas sp. HMM57]
MTLSLLLILFFIGLANGFYSGLMGTGGNIILIPALDLVLVSFGIEGPELVKYIIAHSLFITVFNGFAVSLKHYRMNNFHIKEVVLIGLLAVIAGYFVSEFLKSTLWYKKVYFDSLFLVLVLLVAIRFLFFKQSEHSSKKQQGMQKSKIGYASLGALTGITSALSGFGGGIVLIPALTDIFGISIRKAASISIGVVMLLAIAVSASYLSIDPSNTLKNSLPYQFGYISLSISIPILVGVFIAAPFGVKIAQRTSAALLRIIFGIVMVILFVKTLIGLF